MLRRPELLGGAVPRHLRLRLRTTRVALPRSNGRDSDGVRQPASTESRNRRRGDGVAIKARGARSLPCGWRHDPPWCRRHADRRGGPVHVVGMACVPVRFDARRARSSPNELALQGPVRPQYCHIRKPRVHGLNTRTSASGASGLATTAQSAINIANTLPGRVSKTCQMFDSCALASDAIPAS